MIVTGTAIGAFNRLVDNRRLDNYDQDSKIGNNWSGCDFRHIENNNLRYIILFSKN